MKEGLQVTRCPGARCQVTRCQVPSVRCYGICNINKMGLNVRLKVSHIVVVTLYKAIGQVSGEMPGAKY